MRNVLTPILDPKALADEISGHHFIDGRLAPPASGQLFDVLSPATREVVGHAAKGNETDVDLAVGAAAKAQGEWAKVPARQRGRMVAEVGRRLAQHVEELARLVALETGKAIRTESRVEARVVSDMFEFFGGLGSEIKGESVPFSPDMLTVTVREPIGVVGAIMPWNLPMMLMAMKVAPAMTAGNAVVAKAAEESPLSALRVAQIAGEVLPAGLFNLVTGFGPECGMPLVKHPRVGKITFTGSVETGKLVYAAAGEKLIPVTLELGGKSPMIVMADADIERAVDGAVTGMRFTRQGQSCTAASRIFVHESVHDAFLEKLKAKVDAMKIGDPLDEATDIGCIISEPQYRRVNDYIALGKRTEGAATHACSALPTEPKLRKGLFVQPHIFTGVKNSSRLCQEEIFGPITCLIKWRDQDDVIAQANDSKYGLAATVWTRDLKSALNATRRLEAGFVQVNQNLVVQPNLSYGGVKQSGLGKEASLESMLEHFTHKKTVIVNMA
ncbi:MAG: aldehyde dehydrogenase family protein [Proteobacteria bacterium]|nr:aldehyde dehydrogenase family protein [Pseudomonadota bacterium]